MHFCSFDTSNTHSEDRQMFWMWGWGYFIVPKLSLFFSLVSMIWTNMLKHLGSLDSSPIHFVCILWSCGSLGQSLTDSQRGWRVYSGHRVRADGFPCLYSCLQLHKQICSVFTRPPLLSTNSSQIKQQCSAFASSGSCIPWTMTNRSRLESSFACLLN